MHLAPRASHLTPQTSKPQTSNLATRNPQLEPRTSRTSVTGLQEVTEATVLSVVAAQQLGAQQAADEKTSQQKKASQAEETRQREAAAAVQDAALTTAKEWEVHHTTIAAADAAHRDSLERMVEADQATLWAKRRDIVTRQWAAMEEEKGAAEAVGRVRRREREHDVRRAVEACQRANGAAQAVQEQRDRAVSKAQLEALTVQRTAEVGVSEVQRQREEMRKMAAEAREEEARRAGVRLAAAHEYEVRRRAGEAEDERLERERRREMMDAKQREDRQVLSELEAELHKINVEAERAAAKQVAFPRPRPPLTSPPPDCWLCMTPHSNRRWTCSRARS